MHNREVAENASANIITSADHDVTINAILVSSVNSRCAICQVSAKSLDCANVLWLKRTWQLSG